MRAFFWTKQLKCNFQWIEPANLRNVWQIIKPGLETTARKAPGGWIPEDVYMSIKAGEAVLHIATADNRYRGFMITRSLDTAEGRKLLIWILYGDASDHLFVDNMEQIDEWARNIGAVKIQFLSPRRGWEKVGAALGFELTQVIYEKEV